MLNPKNVTNVERYLLVTKTKLRVTILSFLVLFHPGSNKTSINLFGLFVWVEIAFNSPHVVFEYFSPLVTLNEPFGKAW